jgi:hypothetical protein
MSIVGGFDVHRRQITFDYIDIDIDIGRFQRPDHPGVPSGAAPVAGSAVRRADRRGVRGRGLHRMAVRGRGM